MDRYYIARRILKLRWRLFSSVSYEEYLDTELERSQKKSQENFLTWCRSAMGFGRMPAGLHYYSVQITTALITKYLTGASLTSVLLIVWLSVLFGILLRLMYRLET